MTIHLPDLMYYLTPSQQRTYNHIPQSLQMIIQNKILYPIHPQDTAIGKLVLEISKWGSPELQEVSEKFFLELLRSHLEIEPYLQRVLGICQKKGFITFFTFVSTKKISYYSAQILLEIIESFEQIFAKQPLILSTLACYEEGGKEKLKQLQAIVLNQSEEKNLFSEAAEKMKYKTTVLLQKYFSVSSSDMICLSSTSESALIELIGLATQGKPSSEDLEEMIQKALQFYAKWAEEDFLLVVNALRLLRPLPCSEVIHTLTLLVIASGNAVENQISESLREFGKGKISLSKWIEELEELTLGLKNRIEESAASLLLRFQGEDPNVLAPLAEKHLKTVERQYEIVEGYCKQWRKLSLSQLVELTVSIRGKKEFIEEDILQLIAIGRLALYRLFHVYLYSTQILAILGKLCHENGCIAQVKTGEGKSFIISLLAFVLAMQHKSVHIISSSRNLAIRDQRNAAPFFEAFGIASSHISKDNADESCFRAQILYGMVSDFEFALMREMLYFTPLFQQRTSSFEEKRFDCAIVDELDNLTIDTALNHARLSYPSEITYEWTYAPILQFTKEKQMEIYSPVVVEELRQVLQDHAEGHFKELAAAIPTEWLMQWLQSARSALSHEEDTNYVVSKNQAGKTRAVIIVDAKNTGRLLRSSRWSKGVHEFVEVKHNLIPKTESLTPLSLSHFIFYRAYRSLFGLTGTLGGKLEREEIKELYGASSFDVPTHCPTVREDLPPKIFASKELHRKAILDRTLLCKELKRPILILCETIRDSQEIETLLKEKNISVEILNEVQEKQEEAILAKAGYPGAVTIATNTASRGTDIQLTKQSQSCGGLHVLVTFFPESQRIEDQARGRAGRQGQKGSSEILVLLEAAKAHSMEIDLPKVQEELLYSLQEKRLSLARIMKHSHFCQSEVERFNFSLVKDFFSLYRQFHQTVESEDFLKKQANSWAAIKINKKELDCSQLPLKDRILAMEAIHLLTQRSHEPTKWRGLLKAAGERVKEKMIAHWSMHFYQKVEELLISSKIENYAVISERLQQTTDQVMGLTGKEMERTQAFFQAVEAAVANEKIEALEQLKRNIQQLYEETQVTWKKYLDASGSGVICYLREITERLENPQLGHTLPIPPNQSATIQ